MAAKPMADRPRVPRTPRGLRRLIAFYHAPQRYAHASWPAAALSVLADMADCPDPPPPPDAPILTCLDSHRIARFVAVLDGVLAQSGADGDDARTWATGDASILRDDERALVRASAPLLLPPGCAASRISDPGAATGSGCLRRYYETQAPAIAARLRLLLPYDGAPGASLAGAFGHHRDFAQGAQEAQEAQEAREARRFLERTWNWGTRQCFW